MQVDARLAAYAVQQLVGVGCLAKRRGRKGGEVRDAELARVAVSFHDDVMKRLLPFSADSVVVADLVQQRGVPSLVSGRHRPGARLRVDDKQVHRVGPDVQNAQPHKRTLRVDTLRHLSSLYGAA